MAKKRYSDKEQLELYVSRVNELVVSRIVKEGNLKYRTKVTFNFENASENEIIEEEPDHDDFKAFLLTFRLMIAQNEPTFFHNVRNTAFKSLKNDMPKEQEYLSGYKEQWSKVMKGEYSNISIDDTKLVPEYVLDMYINGVYFHNDIEHRIKLSKLEKSAMRLDKMQLYDTVIGLTRIIFWLAGFIQEGFKEDWFVFEDES